MGTQVQEETLTLRGSFSRR